MKNKILTTAVALAVAVACWAVAEKFFRLDLTQEKRYSLSQNTKKLMEGLDDDLKVKIYLDGDLNAGFLRLRKATKEMLDEFQAYSSSRFDYAFVNPTQGKNEEERDKNYEALEQA